MPIQVGWEEAQMRRCKELVGHHHRPTETSTNYTTTGTQPLARDGRRALQHYRKEASTLIWRSSPPMLCHLRMSLRYPIGIHREAPDLINLFKKLLLSDVICDAPHHLWVITNKLLE